MGCLIFFSLPAARRRTIQAIGQATGRRSDCRNALYRNLGNGKFEEVAQKAGVDRNNFYGIGVAAADYDNDGLPDLYITGYPRSALWHNNRDGTFTDVTEKAGVANAGKFARAQPGLTTTAMAYSTSLSAIM